MPKTYRFPRAIIAIVNALNGMMLILGLIVMAKWGHGVVASGFDDSAFDLMGYGIWFWAGLSMVLGSAIAIATNQIAGASLDTADSTAEMAALMRDQARKPSVNGRREPGFDDTSRNLTPRR